MTNEDGDGASVESSPESTPDAEPKSGKSTTKPAPKKAAPSSKRKARKSEPASGIKPEKSDAKPKPAKTAKPAPKKAAPSSKRKPESKSSRSAKKPKGAKAAEDDDKQEKTLEEVLEEELSDEEIENFQIDKVDMERLTNKVCEMLAACESAGMIQNELWKKFKLTSRDGSRLALKLERTGLINREKLLVKGRWTYKLILKKTPISTQSIENAPCLVCPVEQRCSLEGEISPRTCQLIETWVMTPRPRAPKPQ